MTYYDSGQARSGYHGVFERLSTHDTKSSYTRKNSPRSADKPSGYSIYHTPGPIPSIQSANSSSSRLVSPKIFDRLANTETYATASMKGKVANVERSKRHTKKTSNAFFERMCYTETFASAKMKGLIDTSPKKPRSTSRGRSVASARSTRSTRSTRTAPGSTSFWDRMSNTETYASAKMKGKIEHVEYDRFADPTSPSQSAISARSVRSSRSTRTAQSSTSFFERLSRTETMSSRQKKKKSNSGSQTPGRERPSSRNYSSTYSKPRSTSRRSPRSTSSSSTPTYGVSKYLTTTTNPISPSARSYVSRDHSVGSAKSSRSARSARSARSTHTATSVRSSRSHVSTKSAKSSASRSVASTRSMTTARSATASIKTARSNSTIKSSYSSYQPQPTMRASERKNATSILKMVNDRGPKPVYSPAPAPKRPSRPKPVPDPAPLRKPDPAPVRKPDPPRPALQFDDDDELSFGSEESDEASLGPSSSMTPAQDAGSVASKSIASKRSNVSASYHEPVVARVPQEEDNSPEPAEDISQKPLPTESDRFNMRETEDFLDELEDGPSNDVPDHEEMAIEEQEIAAEQPEEEDPDDNAAIAQISRASFVEEDDDDFSFGSEEEDEDEWMGPKKETANEEVSRPQDPQNVEGDDDDELDDVLGSSPEMNAQESADEPNDLQLDEPVDSMNSVSYQQEKDDISVASSEEEVAQEEGIEVIKTKTDSEENPDFDNDDDMEYEDEEEELEEQEPEDDYDEKEDLHQMDSLDLVLDVSKSQENHTHEMEDEPEFEEEFQTIEQVNSSMQAEESNAPWVILKSEKYHPEYGFEEIDPDHLYLRETLEAFQDGEISNEEIAILLIEAMFDRDFDNGDHWEIDSGTARELEEDEGGGGDLEDRAFVVKRQARLDWNDLYSVAASKGTIIIDPEKKELRIENYSYFVAG